MGRIALSSPSPLASASGETVAEMGGNAADVAIVMALVAMCTEPGVCAPGSGGYVTVDPAVGNPVVVDGYMAVPGIGFGGVPSSRSVTMAYGGGLTTYVGPGSVAVPGSFASLSAVSVQYGRVPWAELLEIVAASLEGGFPLSRAAYTYFLDSGKPIFYEDPATRQALFEDGTVREMGEIVTFENLASTLREIGSEGAKCFYQGDLAHRIVADLADRGSSITREDMARYEPIVRDPLKSEIEGWTVVANPPPAVGGVVVLDALRNVAGSNDPLSHETWLDGLVAAFGHRKDYESTGNPAAIGELLRVAGLRSPSTITVAAVDSDDLAVAATYSAGYGSGVIPKGTGLLMNNSVGEIELLPGGVDALIPGERMMSNMAPTTVRKGTNVVAIGSPGADRITSALVITLIRFLLAGDDLDLAVEYPRLHPESLEPLQVAIEPGISLPDVNVRAYDDHHMFFGGVNGAGLVDGELVASADSRRTGAALVV